MRVGSVFSGSSIRVGSFFSGCLVGSGSGSGLTGMSLSGLTGGSFFIFSHDLRYQFSFGSQFITNIGGGLHFAYPATNRA